MKPPAAIDTPPHIRLEEIFAQAAALPEADRAAFLDGACAGEPALRAEVGVLLLSHEAGGFMKGAARKADIEAELARLKPEEAGERIGNYKLLEQIGEGGFGVVWVAEQEKPVRRRVALKIIKLGMDTKQVIARFEQERQALAMMDHPNIAKVFDAGATQHGRPFFVMELVRGIKITDYCDQANLPTVDRLDLFIAVCKAVQHAHQKGIIHRDLKPSNILITLHDGTPAPKIIDFGVAKATQQQRLTDLTIYTQFEQMIGTPLYMSPEQAEMSSLDIDARSDIYSLGVLLYELLVGRTPFDPEHLMKQGLDEIRRTIRELEPPKPSTALQTMAAELQTLVASHRQIDPARITRLLRGDLDWIVMKALEKDRTRRYETANGFAVDIQRYLGNEPVSAGPPTARYRFRKFARRNKTFLRFATATAVVLLATAIVSVSLVNDVVEERNAKEEARKNALVVMENLVFSYAADGRIEEAIKLEEEVLALRRKVLGLEDPDTLLALINLAAYHYNAGHHDEALKQAEGAFALCRKLQNPDHEHVHAAARVLAASYIAVGRRPEAAKLEQQISVKSPVLHSGNRAATQATLDLANAFQQEGRTEDALPLWEEVLARRPKDWGLFQKVAALQAWFRKDAEHAASCRRMLESVRGTSDLSTAGAAKAYCLRPSSDPELLAAAFSLAQRAVELCKYGNPLLGQYQTGLGIAKYRKGDYEAANRDLAAGERLAADNANILPLALFFRSMSLFQQGSKLEAGALFADAVTRMEGLPVNWRQPPLEENTGEAKIVIWLAYIEAKEMLPPEVQAGGWERARKLAEDVVVQNRKSKGTGAKQTIESVKRLAELHDAAGHPDDGLRVLTEASIDAPQDATLAIEVAALQIWLGKNEDYLDTCRRAVAYAESATDDVTRAQRVAAKIASSGPHGDAALQNRALTLVRQAAAAPDAPLAWSALALGMAEFRAGNYNAADKALVIPETTSPDEDLNIKGPAQLFRAMTLFRQGNTTQAVNLFSQAEAQLNLPRRGKRVIVRNPTYRDNLQVWLAYEEARALLQAHSPPKPAAE